ncbi:MAG TPA: hypothetical protein PK359_14305, partial [Burkholderiaceae bacterium]|nr:hypothetical protein [Burkholderiaceae bacterium]
MTAADELKVRVASGVPSSASTAAKVESSALAVNEPASEKVADALDTAPALTVSGAIRLAADAPAGDDYVIATGISHSVSDLVDAAFTHCGITDWQRHVVVDPEFFRP